MASLQEVEQGQAVYSKRVLSIYDLWVLGFSNRYIWKCPTQILKTHFNQHLSANHLDVGVGTGYFLDHAQFPETDIRIGLMDLNQTPRSALRDTTRNTTAEMSLKKLK